MKIRINELIESQEVCSVYTNADETNKFAVGYILSQDEKYFLMESIDQYGKNDGIFCSLIDNVIKIETDTEYVLCIEKLFVYLNQMRHPKLNIKKDILTNLIEYSIANHKICHVELCNSGYDDAIGFIKKLDKDSLDVEIINSYGKKDGMETINLGDISHISCDSTDEIKLEALFKINN